MVIVVRRLLVVEVIHQIIRQHLAVSILTIRNVLNQWNVFCIVTETYEMGKDITKYFIEIRTKIFFS